MATTAVQANAEDTISTSAAIESVRVTPVEFEMSSPNQEVESVCVANSMAVGVNIEL